MRRNNRKQLPHKLITNGSELTAKVRAKREESASRSLHSDLLELSYHMKDESYFKEVNMSCLRRI
jgi:hypothetical protein